MRTISIPRTREAASFDYRCPVCDADLGESDYERFDADYFCPVCSTQLRPSRVLGSHS
jgi:rubredoxin